MHRWQVILIECHNRHHIHREHENEGDDHDRDGNVDIGFGFVVTKSFYVHGGVVESRYPLLHYFEISLMLSCVIPSVYEMFCEDYAEESDVFGINVLDKIKADYILLCEQYEKRSTENFEMKN